MPPAVKAQRRAMGWTYREQDFVCWRAFCSIPALELVDEEVVISVDKAAGDGACRMMLQSLLRPDLGVSVLRLEADGRLVGGDESWAPGEQNVIVAFRTGPGMPTSPSRSAAVPVKPAEPAAVKRPQPRARLPVDRPERELEPPERELEPMEEVDERMPLPVGGWKAEPDDGARKAVAGGVGRSAGGTTATKAPQPSAVSDVAIRPDMAAGPGLPENQKTGALLDEEIQAAADAAAERLVAAASAGELGDVKVLLHRTAADRPRLLVGYRA